MPVVHQLIDGSQALDLHPEVGGEPHTLVAIYADRAKAAKVVQDKVSLGLQATIIPFAAPDGAEMQAVVARGQIVPRARTPIPYQYSVDWQYVRLIAALFRERVRKAREPVRWYKELEVEKLHEVGQGIRWDLPRIEVAAHLLSEPILRHCLPNANHRTNLVATALYLEHEGIRWPSYRLTGRGMQHFWRDMNRHFVVESKYWLQLYRRVGLIRSAFGHGFASLRIGHSRYRAINEQDLDMDRKQVRTRHKQLARDFIGQLCPVAEAEKLRGRPHSTGEEFLGWALD